MHLVSFHPRARLDVRDLPEVLRQSIQDLDPELAVRALPTSKHDRRLDFVTFHQESLDVVFLESVIMVIDLQAKFDFFDLNLFLVLLRFMSTLVLLV